MNDLRAQLSQILQGRVCLVGVGNADWGDDAFGVRLAEELKKFADPEREPNLRSRGHEAQTDWKSEPPRAGCDISSIGSESREGANAQIAKCRVGALIRAGREPERYVTELIDGNFNAVIFLDAVEFGGDPGSVVLLNSAEMAAQFPQISTHKISLGLLAKMVEASRPTKVWLLGVQPETLEPGRDMSSRVRATAELLTAVLTELFRVAPASGRAFSASRREGKRPPELFAPASANHRPLVAC